MRTLKNLQVGLCLAFLVIGAVAQTVTTTGGTTNTVPKFTGATTIGNSAIVENSGSVGVGTTTPNAKLNVSDSFAGNRDVLVVDNPNGANGSGVTTAIRLDNGPNQMSRLFVRRDNNEFVIQNIETGSTAGITFQSGASTIGRFDASGNFGIGTASPAFKLDVAGNIRIAGVGNGLVFPNGTIQTTATALTGALAGSGLVGGGTVGNVTLSVDSTVARNNTSQTFNGFVQANGAFSSFLG